MSQPYERADDKTLQALFENLKAQVIDDTNDMLKYLNENPSKDADLNAYDLANANARIKEANDATTLKGLGDVAKRASWDFDSFMISLAIAARDTDPEYWELLTEDDGWGDNAIRLLHQRYRMFADEGDTREWAAKFDT
jgi:hypothetical protein